MCTSFSGCFWYNCYPSSCVFVGISVVSVVSTVAVVVAVLVDVAATGDAAVGFVACCLGETSFLIPNSSSFASKEILLNSLYELEFRCHISHCLLYV